ncbi:MAG: hypothetical protein JNL05_05800 [Flavobacteriales bacterium]|nr:hypothetical protein [Flavobacteriales bacterium]
MNRPDAFDDLARQKLEERAFPFDEGHWQDMQRVLAEERRRKRRALYWGIGTGLLLITAGTAAFLAARPDREVVAERTVDQRTAPAVTVTSTEQQANASSADHAATSTPDARAAAAATSNPPVNAAKPVASNAPQAATPAAGSAHKATPEARPGQGEPAAHRPRAKAAAEAPVIEPAQQHAPAKPATADAATDGTGTDAGNGIAAGIAAGGNAPNVSADAQKAPTDDPLAQQRPSATSDTTSHPAPTPAEPPQAPGVPLVANTTTPEDTTNAPSVPPAAPPIVAPASPWELTVWGGMQRSRTRYSGAEVPWAGTISDANAPAYGAEVMHMGRHIGLGAGLHYITYAERYQQPELYTRILDIDPVYSIISLDTTLLVVTGTVLQNGQVFYTTEQVDTTVYVLDVSADTTILDIRTQEGVDRVNQVSYLELPLFVDGHLDAGRWCFGLRGGPTVGLLTGRRGSMPIIDPSGVISLEDQPFREYMFGWTMRGYVRYRLGERWWLGVEPMMRGQLMNAYSMGSLERRSTGMGIGFSVSWRLP